MAFCTSCGANVPEGVKFCISCGANMATGDGVPATRPLPPAVDFRPYPPAPGRTAIRSSGGDYGVISAWNWLGSLILLSIPGVGLVVCIIWAVASSNPNRRNFSRAALILSAAAIILSAVIAVVFGWMVWPAVKSTAAAYKEQYKSVVGIMPKTPEMPK